MKPYLNELHCISLSSLNISSKYLDALILVHFQWEFLKHVHAWLLPYEGLNIVMAVWSDFLKDILPFTTFHQKVCMHNSYILNGNFSNCTCTLITYILRFTNCYSILINLILKEILPFFTLNISSRKLYAQFHILFYKWELQGIFPKR
jgi:hypothetical protein